MDQAQLRLLLEAGPSRQFNVAQISRRLQAEKRDSELLFQTSFLNGCILWKYVDRHSSCRGNGGRTVPMLIFLPFDPTRPESGGEAILYNSQNLKRLYASKTGVTELMPTTLLDDDALLDRLDALPALNPFLLRDLVEDGSDRIPEAYLELDKALVQRVTRRLERRVRPLIVAAFETSGDAVNKAVDIIVRAFVDKDTRHHLKGLGPPLNLDPEEAVDVLGAWAGIAFFEDEIAQLKPEVHGFAEWVAKTSALLKKQGGGPEHEMACRLAGVRHRAAECWRELRGILDHYQQSYDMLVFQSQPRAFVAFLKRSREFQWRLAELTTQFDLAVHAQPKRGASAGNQVSVEVLKSLVSALERIFASATEAPGIGHSSFAAAG